MRLTEDRMEFTMISKIESFRILESSLCQIPPKVNCDVFWQNISTSYSKVWIFHTIAVLDFSETSKYDFEARMEFTIISKIKGFRILESSICQILPNVILMICRKPFPFFILGSGFFLTLQYPICPKRQSTTLREARMISNS